MQLTKEQEVMTQVIQKCWTDASFKSQLVNAKDPIGFIESFTGTRIELPQGFEFVVVDQSDPLKVHLNIPPEPVLDDLALSDADMEAVAGGAFWDKYIHIPTLPQTPGEDGNIR